MLVRTSDDDAKETKDTTRNLVGVGVILAARGFQLTLYCNTDS